MKKKLMIGLILFLCAALAVFLVLKLTAPSSEELFRNAIEAEDYTDWYTNSRGRSVYMVHVVAKDHPALQKLLELPDLKAFFQQAGYDIILEYRYADSPYSSTASHLEDMMRVLFPELEDWMEEKEAEYHQ